MWMMNFGKKRQKLNLTCNLSLLFFVSVWKCPIIVNMLSLALGICIPSNTVYDTLSPECFQIKWAKIFQDWNWIRTMIICNRRSISMIGRVTVWLIAWRIYLSRYRVPWIIDIFYQINVLRQCLWLMSRRHWGRPLPVHRSHLRSTTHSS